MKPIIAKKSHLTARIVMPLKLQILLVVLLRRPHQDSPILMLLLSVFPQFVILATILHVLGWSGLFTWLVKRFQF